MTVLKMEFSLIILNWLMYHLYLKREIVLKKNYGPVSILPHMSKVFERIFYKQIDTFMTTKFSPYLCGFRKNHKVQYSLLKIIETWKKHLDKGEKIGEIMMDLSKAFDTINDSFAIGKIRCVRFFKNDFKTYAKLLIKQAAKNFYKWLI